MDPPLKLVVLVEKNKAEVIVYRKGIYRLGFLAQGISLLQGPFFSPLP